MHGRVMYVGGSWYFVVTGAVLTSLRESTSWCIFHCHPNCRRLQYLGILTSRTYPIWTTQLRLIGLTTRSSLVLTPSFLEKSIKKPKLLYTYPRMAGLRARHSTIASHAVLSTLRRPRHYLWKSQDITSEYHPLIPHTTNGLPTPGAH